MGAHINPATGQLEDDNGNPITFANNAGQTSSSPMTPGLPVLPPVVPQPMVPPTGLPPGQAPFVPAPPVPGMERTSSQTTTSRELPTKGEDEVQKRIEAGFGKQAGQAREEGDLLERKAGVEAAGETELSKASVEREKSLATETASSNKRIASAEQQVSKDRAKYDAETARLGKMDIKDFYEGRTGARVASAIAIAMGELGRALSGGKSNSALEIIKGAERDYFDKQRFQIEKQEHAVAGAKEAISLSREGVAGERQGKADRYADLNLAGAARMDAIASKVRAEAARIGTEHARLAGEKLATGVELTADEYRAKYKEGLRGKVSTVNTSMQGTGAAGGAGGAKNNDTLVYGPDGKPMAQARAPEEAKTANAANASFGQLDGLLSAYAESWAKHGMLLNPLSEAYGQRKAIEGQATIAVKNAGGLGQISAGDQGLINAIFAGKYGKDTMIAKLAEARASFRSNHEKFLASKGLEGGPAIARAWSTGAAASAAPAGGQRQTRKLKNGSTVSGTLQADGSFQVD